MIFKQIFDSHTSTYTYLLADAATREAVIIDPVLERVDRDVALISELGLKLLYTIDTHAHADHITAADQLRKRLNAQSVVSSSAGVQCVDVAVEHGDRIEFGSHSLEVRHTPGHTKGCATFVLDTDGETKAFTGDTLLVRGCGRTDFQEGSADDLYRSVHEQIFSLPDETRIYPGHDYKGHSSTTVAEEKAHNPRLNTGVGPAEFAQIMAELDLPPPAPHRRGRACESTRRSSAAEHGAEHGPEHGPDEARVSRRATGGAARPVRLPHRRCAPVR